MSLTSTPSVSPRAEQALRDAMNRLLDGGATRTDGQLTKNNLFREAQVSRATMNRATTILTEWDTRTAAARAGAVDATHRDQIAQLRTDLAKAREERRDLQDRVDAAATVIAALAAENAALRDQLATRTATLIPLARARAARE
jgi:hypothetical protein